MLRHYLLTAKRSLLRHKASTFINLLGLSLGLASALMLFTFIYNQHLKDVHITHLDRYVRVESATELRANEGFGTGTHPGIGPALKDQLPQVEEYLRMNALTLDASVPEGEFQDKFVRGRFLQVDPSFFQLFPQSFIIGNETTALQDKTSILLTEEMATRLFGSANPIGKQIETTQTHRSPLTIAGIVKAPHPNSSLQFDFLYANDFPYDLSSPGFTRTSTYLKVRPNTSLEELTEAVNKTIAPLATGNYMKSFRYRISDFNQLKYDLNTADTVIVPADKELLTIFSVVATFILLLAIVNYVNLSTSKALQRAQEAGIRKILGAGRSSFFFQFVLESVVLCLLSLPVAILIFEVARPYFEMALDTSLAIGITNSTVFFSALSLVLITGFLAGLYPALLITKFKFHEFIKGNLFANQRGAGFRKVLVTFQFAIAMLLIICAVIVQQQLRFARQQKLTYEPEQILLLDRALSKKFDLLQNDLNEIPGVLQSSLSTSPPGGDDHRSSGGPLKLGEVVYTHDIDHQYAAMLNLEFVYGENFNSGQNEQGVIINETLARLLVAANPKQMEKPLEGKYQFRFTEQKIKAIVKDFHLESMHEKIKPMVFFYEPFEGYTGAYTMLKISTQNLTNTLKQLETVWYEHIPRTPFRYTFLDQRFESLYTAEIRLSQIFNVFTGIAITISCLGLYGLITFMAAAKSKEVGIRKVLGATVMQIVLLFTQNIYGLLGLASLIAIPLAYWAMHAWLQGFAYHINISLTVFLLAISAIFLIAGGAVISKVVRSANTNPVEVLRSE